MNTTTFSVSYLTRKCKADKKRADIYARIIIDGEEKELSTKEQIPLSSWDSVKLTTSYKTKPDIIYSKLITQF